MVQGQQNKIFRGSKITLTIKMIGTLIMSRNYLEHLTCQYSKETKQIRMLIKVNRLICFHLLIMRIMDFREINGSVCSKISLVCWVGKIIRESFHLVKDMHWDQQLFHYSMENPHLNLCKEVVGTLWQEEA